MKQLIVLCLVLVIPTVLTAQEQWKSYGDTLSVNKPVSLHTALSMSRAADAKETLIEGTITEVCQNKGCWMVVADSKDTIRVEFKDYSFFVPWDSENKQVRLQGVIKEKAVSKKTVEHMVGEMKTPPANLETEAETQTITVFVASAVEIMNGSEIGEEQQDVLDGKTEREGHQHEDHDEH